MSSTTGTFFQILRPNTFFYRKFRWSQNRSFYHELGGSAFAQYVPSGAVHLEMTTLERWKSIGCLRKGLATREGRSVAHVCETARKISAATPKTPLKRPIFHVSCFHGLMVLIFPFSFESVHLCITNIGSKLPVRFKQPALVVKRWSGVCETACSRRPIINELSPFHVLPHPPPPDGEKIWVMRNCAQLSYFFCSCLFEVLLKMFYHSELYAIV